MDGQIESLGEFEELDSSSRQFGALERINSTLFTEKFVNESAINATNNCFERCKQESSECEGVQLVLDSSDTVWCYGLSIGSGTSEEECIPAWSCKSYAKGSSESTTTEAVSTLNPWRSTVCRPIAQICT